MINKTFILRQAKTYLPADDRHKEQQLNDAYELGVTDLFNKFLSSDRLLMKEIDVAASARTVDLLADQDIDSLFYIRYGTGETQKLLTYIPLSEFLKKYSNPSAEVGTPTYYTLMGINPESGLDQIKFDVPAVSATTLELYYYMDVNLGLVKGSQGPALINVTVAYFFGVGSEQGRGYYQAYRINIGDARAKNKKVVDKESRFIPNQTDANIESVRRNMRNNRA